MRERLTSILAAKSVFGLALSAFRGSRSAAQRPGGNAANPAGTVLFQPASAR